MAAYAVRLRYVTLWISVSYQKVMAELAARAEIPIIIKKNVNKDNPSSRENYVYHKLLSIENELTRLPRL